jgi:hypothetical protein
VIIGGGLLITRRLRLLALAATSGSRSPSGSAARRVRPLHDRELGVRAGLRRRLLAVIVTSPEVLIFLFFMITDPKTVPAGRSGGSSSAPRRVASTLLMAPQTNEFGTKVALLGGLVVVCAAGRSSTGSCPSRSPRRTTSARSAPARRAGPARGLLAARRGPARSRSSCCSCGAGIVSPARPARGLVVADDAGALDASRTRSTLDLPAITRRPGRRRLDHTIADRRARTSSDPRREPGAREPGAPPARPVDPRGGRPRRPPAEMQAGSTEARRPGRPSSTTTGSTRWPRADRPFGVQTGLSLGFDATGTLTEETYDANGTLVDAASRRST